MSQFKDRIFAVTWTVCLLFSCNSGHKAVGTGEAGETGVERETLINALKQLKSQLASKDEHRITELFEFPIPDSIVPIYVFDDSFDARQEASGGLVTRSMFNDFFSQISESIQMEDVNTLFANVRLDSLHQTNVLTHEVQTDTIPCRRHYQLEVHNDSVTLTLEQLTKPGFQGPDMTETGPSNESSEYCEKVLWWIFKFEGNKLRLVKISGAG